MTRLSISEKQVTDAVNMIFRLAYESYNDRRSYESRGMKYSGIRTGISRTEYNKIKEFCYQGNYALKILRRQYESVQDVKEQDKK